MTTIAEKFALSIVQRLQAAGHVAYFAGGCVRDRLMGGTPEDFDVATSATPEQVLRLFPRSQQVGVAFGVVLVREKRSGAAAPLQIEVATFRCDGTYSDGRHPDSVSFTTAEQDAQRRDFTCNGLFLDPLADPPRGRLHDFVGGQEDIAHKVLRAIGDPAARFSEDHLRMLRAVRFAARMAFTIEARTREAVVRLAPKIRTISRERIGDEFGRILEHPSRGIAVRLLEELGLLAQIWPPDSWPPPPPHASAPAQAAAERWPRLDHLPRDIPRTLALAALLRDLWLDCGVDLPETSLARIAETLQQAFALSNEERADILWLLQKLPLLVDRAQWTRPAHKKLLADPRWPLLRDLYRAERRGIDHPDLDAWIATLRAEPGGVAPAPFITGETLIQLGATPGRAFKLWLETFYDRQLNNEFSTRDEAVAAAAELVRRGS